VLRLRCAPAALQGCCGVVLAGAAGRCLLCQHVARAVAARSQRLVRVYACVALKAWRRGSGRVLVMLAVTAKYGAWLAFKVLAAFTILNRHSIL
jgi:hypothetical protein